MVQVKTPPKPQTPNKEAAASKGEEDFHASFMANVGMGPSGARGRGPPPQAGVDPRVLNILNRNKRLDTAGVTTSPWNAAHAVPETAGWEEGREGYGGGSKDERSLSTRGVTFDKFKAPGLQPFRVATYHHTLPAYA